MKDYKYIRFKDRRGSSSEKWDNLVDAFGRDDLIAAWVADMDIESPDCVKDALAKYHEFNVYAYYCVNDSYHDAIIQWHRKRHCLDIEREWIRFTPGVVQGIYWIIKMLTLPKNSVLIMPPVYYPFKNAVVETNRTLVNVPLLNDKGFYTIDFDSFERAIIENNVKVFILCSPHNPVGRVWTKEELKELMDICLKHNVYVIADEIHNDIILGDNKHTCTSMVSKPGEYDSILVTLMSASKTFNLAAMNHAYAIIPDDALREKFDAFVRELHVTEGTPFGYISYEAAYREGEPWAEEMLDLIERNYCILKDGLEERLPGAVVSPLQGTYLAWIDLSSYIDDNVQDAIGNICKIAPDYGEWFGGDDYNKFIRINLATSTDMVKEIVRRLALIKDI